MVTERTDHTFVSEPHTLILGIRIRVCRSALYPFYEGRGQKVCLTRLSVRHVKCPQRRSYFGMKVVITVVVGNITENKDGLKRDKEVETKYPSKRRI